MKPKDAMTIDEFSENLKVSKSTHYKLAQDGKLLDREVGKHRRFHKNVINR